MWIYPQDPQPCPPDSAVSVTGLYFRAVLSNPPAATDFASWFTLKPERWNPHDRCKAAGLSMFSNLRDAQKLVKTLPQFKGKKLAALRIAPPNGVVQQTPSQTSRYHCTWWPAPTTDCLKLVVEIPTEV